MSTIPAAYLPGGQKERFACGRCHALAEGGPVHGWGNPCPAQVQADEAYVAMLDAQRMSYIRSAGGMEAMGEALVRIAGEDDS